MALEFRDPIGSSSPSGRNGTIPQLRRWHSSGSQGQAPFGGYGCTPGTAPKKRHRTGVVWAALLLLCLLIAGVLLLRGTIGRPSEPSPRIEPGAIEVPSPGGGGTSSEKADDVRALAEKIIPQFHCRYLVQQLDDRMLENFLTLYQTVADFKAECKFPNRIREKELDALLTLLRENCPELFQLDVKEGIWRTTTGQGDNRVVTEVTSIPYLMDADTYRQAYRECSQIVSEVVNGAQGLSPYEAELYVYQFITSHCVYDLSTQYCATPYGALVEGRAKCDGTAKTAQWILERLGMVVMSVSGDPMDGEIGHQWNVIEINGTFYDLDVTADLGTETDKLLYGRFNVNDRLIRDIYPIRSSYQTCFTVPGTSSTAGSYHARNHTLVASGADYGPMLADLISRATQSGGGSFSIQFSSKTQMDEMLQIFESWDRANQFLKEYGASLDGFSYSQHYQAESYVCSLTLTWYQ